jgi:hypothetical protein
LVAAQLVETLLTKRLDLGKETVAAVKPELEKIGVTIHSVDLKDVMFPGDVKNHSLIHRHLAQHLGLNVLLDVENHHNFAWKERRVIDGVERDVVVHRKGTTLAGTDVLGIIPGSMAYMTESRGNSIARLEHSEAAWHGQASRFRNRRDRRLGSRRYGKQLHTHCSAGLRTCRIADF